MPYSSQLEIKAVVRSYTLTHVMLRGNDLLGSLTVPCNCRPGKSIGGAVINAESVCCRAEAQTRVYKGAVINAESVCCRAEAERRVYKGAELKQKQECTREL